MTATINQIRPVPRHTITLDGAHYHVTRDLTVLREGGAAGRHGHMLRPVAQHVAAKVVAGLSREVVR